MVELALSKLAKRRAVVVDLTNARTNAELLRHCLEKLNWKEANGDADADIYWHALVPTDMRDTIRVGKINKFAGMNELTKKVSLTRALNTMKVLFPDEYTFYPLSWFIPAQLNEFYEDFYMNLEYNTRNRIPWYIVKPDHGCQGGGIYLIHTPEQLHEIKEPQLIQEYIADPFLFQDNLKFDFRVYAVIRSLNPLSIYVSKEGMARFCTMEYRPPSMGNSVHSFMHLTNYSLNKFNENYVAGGLEDGSGSKRLLSTVFHQMEARGHDTRLIWHKIRLIVVKTVIAMIPEMILYYEEQYFDGIGPSCFQILGFDILLTQSLEPILLEVNACPSLSMKLPESDVEESELSLVDRAIKYPVVRDTLLLVMDDSKSKGRLRRGDAKKKLTRSGCSDDSSVDGEECCLDEVFPAQYGHSIGPMLFLHRAAYLYLHFIDIRRSLYIGIAGCRMFARKCNLGAHLNQKYLDETFAKIHKRWEGYSTTGIPFNGFVELLLNVADRKFPHARNNAEGLRSLLHYCEFQLSYHGVCSSRLRPDRESLASAKEKGRLKQLTEIYLLPLKAGSSRLRRSARSNV